MRKICLIIPGLVIFSLALILSPTAMAATLTFNAETNLSLPSGTSLVITSGSQAESAVINDDSTISVGLASDSDITIKSAEGRILSVSPSSVAANNCVSSTNSNVRLTSATTQTVTITASASFCSFGGGSTGGTPGGGGGGTLTVPSATLISISAGAASTETVSVTLTLGATNASTMLISNKSDFSDVSSWLTYAASKAWTLTAGAGTKTVYVKFRSSDGGESAAKSDTSELVEPAAAKSGDITGTAGGTVILSGSKVSVIVPAGAISGSGTVTITPTTTYTAPAAGTQVVGGKAYDLTLMVGGTAATTFSKAVTLTFTYTDAEIVNLEESTLQVYYWDTTTSAWVKLGGAVDAANNKITVTTTHFTKFAVLGTVKASRAGKLVKLACPANADVNHKCKAVYYVGNNSRRYVFPHEKTFKTWYADYSGVETIGETDLASYMIGGNVTYRPGVKMIKITTDPKVYAVDKNGTLRWLKTADVAKAIYGSSWSSLVEDVADSYFVNYKAGSDVAAAADFDKTAAANGSATINIDKGL